MIFAIKELLYGKKKYILIELLLILLMFMVLFLSGLASGLGRAVIAGIESMNADYFLLNDSAEKLITVSELPDEAMNEIKTQTVAELAPLDIQRMYLQKQDADEKINITYFAEQPGSFIEPEIMEGKGLANTHTKNPIVLDDDFMVQGISLGDTVRDSSSGLEFTVVGFAKDQMYGHVSIGFITTEDYTALRTALNPHYEQAYHAIAVKGDVSGVKIDGCELISKDEVIKSIPSYSAEHTTINMIVWVLVIVSAVIIGIFSYILTLQKRKQFGVMKAVGLGMGKLASIVISQNLLLSLFAAVIAGLLTFGMREILPQTMPFYLQMQTACAVSTAFVVISVLSSLLSIINIARIDPVQAIGGGDE